MERKGGVNKYAKCVLMRLKMRLKASKCVLKRHLQKTSSEYEEDLEILNCHVNKILR
jgi:hypothetical protein